MDQWFIVEVYIAFATFIIWRIFMTIYIATVNFTNYLLLLVASKLFRFSRNNTQA